MLTSIDRSFEFWFYVPLPLDTKQAISETLLQANLSAWYGKSKSNTNKSTRSPSTEMYYNAK